MDLKNQINQFLAGAPHAVVGASRDRAKYGNKVLRVYQQHQRPVYAINPNSDVIEGVPAYPDLLSLPEPVHGLSIITPPPVTEHIVKDAIQLGIKHIWIQPGAESEEAITMATTHGVNVISNGACILVVLGFHE